MIVIEIILELWFWGFVVIALVALSNFIFSTDPERGRPFPGRLSTALLWPIAILSAAGRARLRRGH